MIRIRPKRFPSGTVKKLQARSAGPFKILKQMGPNAYVIDLPHDYGISSSFNIEDLVAYKASQLFLIPLLMSLCLILLIPLFLPIYP